MPKLDNKNGTAATAKPPKAPKSKAPKSTDGAQKAAKKAEGRPVVFPEVRTFRCFGPDAIRYQTMVDLLGFETEEQYAERVAKEEGLKDSKGIKLHERDVVGTHELTGKFQLRNNAGNRPLTLSWSESIAQDILAGQWVGPTTMPTMVEYTYGGADGYKMADGTILNKGDKITLTEGTVNGETMIVSRSGLVKSAQHRGFGFILAVLEWRRNPEKYSHVWPTEPVLETLITYGVSDHERVTTTMDTTLARTEADSFYSTGAVGRIFGAQATSMTRKDQAVVCKALQACVDFLWQRVGKGQYHYQTHTAVQRFLDDHPKVYDAVKHIWEENQNFGLSLLRLSPGQSAACCYLMAASKSSTSKWDAQHGTQKELDMSYWSAAKDFWSDLAGKKTPSHKAIADAIGALMDDPESPSRGIGKLAIVAQAWSDMRDGGKLGSLDLEYDTDDQGRRALVNAPGFGGIDLGPKLRKIEDEDEPSAEDVEAEKKRIREENAKKPAPAKPIPAKK